MHASRSGRSTARDARPRVAWLPTSPATRAIDRAPPTSLRRPSVRRRRADPNRGPGPQGTRPRRLAVHTAGHMARERSGLSSLAAHVSSGSRHGPASGSRMAACRRLGRGSRQTTSPGHHHRCRIAVQRHLHRGGTGRHLPPATSASLSRYIHTARSRNSRSYFPRCRHDRSLLAASAPPGISGRFILTSSPLVRR